MGSQKVPGVAVLHCNDRTCGNAYLMTFKVRPLRAHTLSQSVLPLVEAPSEDSFWNLPEFLVTFELMSSMAGNHVPLRPIFRVRNSKKSLWARSGECGGWVMTGTAAHQEMCGSVRYSDAETTAPACHLSRCFLCKTCMYKLAVTLCPDGTNSWCSKPPWTFWLPLVLHVCILENSRKYLIKSWAINQDFSFTYTKKLN
jgi:hypothetical protein